MKAGVPATSFGYGNHGATFLQDGLLLEGRRRKNGARVFIRQHNPIKEPAPVGGHHLIGMGEIHSAFVHGDSIKLATPSGAPYGP